MANLWSYGCSIPETTAEGRWEYGRSVVIFTYTAGGGVTYTQSLAGTLQFSGALTTLPALTFEGSLSFSGKVTKTIPKLLSGTLNLSGTLKKHTTKTLSGTLSFAGDVVRSFTQTISGALNFAGSLTTVLNPQPVVRHALKFLGKWFKKMMQ